MRHYDLFHEAKYKGGTKSKREAVEWARPLADRTGVPVEIRDRERVVTVVTPRGARTAATLAARRFA